MSQDRAAVRAQRDAEIKELQADYERMKAQHAATMKQLDEIETGWKAALEDAGMDPQDVLDLAVATGASDIVTAVHQEQEAASDQSAPKTAHRPKKTRTRI